MTRLFLLLALLAPALPAKAAEPDPAFAALARWSIDDGGRAAPALPVPGAPLEFLEAGERWGREAQLSALAEVPPPPSGLRFAVLGDVEPGRFWFTRVLPPKRDAFERQVRRIQGEERPEFILQLGDLVSRGTEENYARFLERIDGEVEVPFFPVLGNHDREKTHGDADKSLFRAIFGDGDFYFDRGGYRFVLIDDSSWRLTPAQLAWLDAVLDTPLETVVAMHIPPAFLRGRIVKPDEIPEEEAGSPRRVRESVGWFAEGAEAFGEIVARRGVARVYMGHLHALGYADYRGVRYVLSGGGGSPVYRAPGIPGEKRTHYLVVEAGPAGIVERIETLRGRSLAFADP